MNDGVCTECATDLNEYGFCVPCQEENYWFEGTCKACLGGVASPDQTECCVRNSNQIPNLVTGKCDLCQGTLEASVDQTECLDCTLTLNFV